MAFYSNAHRATRCNCRKSGCLKKYCDCFSSGRACGLGCKCDGCKNCVEKKEDCVSYSSSS